MHLHNLPFPHPDQRALSFNDDVGGLDMQKQPQRIRLTVFLAVRLSRLRFMGKLLFESLGDWTWLAWMNLLVDLTEQSSLNPLYFLSITAHFFFIIDSGL